MDRPFREIHELYKLLYERAIEQQKAEEERKKAEAEEAKKNPSNKRYVAPTDVQRNPVPTPSPSELEMLEEAMEELS